MCSPFFGLSVVNLNNRRIFIAAEVATPYIFWGTEINNFVNQYSINSIDYGQIKILK